MGFEPTPPLGRLDLKSNVLTTRLTWLKRYVTIRIIFDCKKRIVWLMKSLNARNWATLILLSNKNNQTFIGPRQLFFFLKIANMFLKEIAQALRICGSNPNSSGQNKLLINCIFYHIIIKEISKTNILDHSNHLKNRLN